MTANAMCKSEKRREDILVSICFTDLSLSVDTFQPVLDAARKVDGCFRFREIVLVVDAAAQEAYFPLIKAIPNVRLFAMRPGSSHYQKRVVAAEEAIGDVVLIARDEEIAHIDVLALIDQASSDGCVVVVQRSAPDPVRKGLWVPLIALGQAAGFNVSPGLLQSLALPRTLLNQLLAHANPELALRFPPRDPRLPIAVVQADKRAPKTRDVSDFKDRLQLVQKLLMYMAPALLMFVTLVSGLLSVLGVSFGLYVLGAWIVVEDLAPGWLTISSMLSVTATFLGVSILGLSLGLQQVLANQRKDFLDGVAEEVNRVDLYGAVVTDLNIDLASDASEKSEGQT